MTEEALVNSLSFFVPVYNEKGSLPGFVEDMSRFLSEVTEDYELIIVDDGSTDGTSELSDELATKDPHIRVIHHESNLNYGRALATGFSSAKKDFIFYTDVDMPGDMELLKEAMELIKDADIIIGYRVGRKEKFRRFVYSWVYNQLLRLLFGVKARDVNFSFKLMRRSVMDGIELKSWTVFVDGELIIKAARKGCRIVEIPVNFKQREIGCSKFDSPIVALKTLWEILRFYVGKL